MKKRILLNGINLDKANIAPLEYKFKHFQEWGWEVGILGNSILKKRFDDGGILKNFSFFEFKRQGNTCSTIGFIREALIRNILGLAYLRKLKNKCDVIYSMAVLDLALFPCFLSKVNKNIKWVVVFDNIVPLSEPGNKIIRFLAWLFFRLSILCIRRADLIFAISDDLKKYLIEAGFAENKIVVTGNAVEVDMIRRAKKDEKNSTDALFVGRINEAKGIYDILKVLEIVKKKYPDFQFAIMGEGDNATEKRFRDKIKAMNLESNIQFLGFKNGQEKFNIIKSSKCFLSTSFRESFGISLLEAVCSGIPAFAYDLPEFRNIYKKGEVIFLKKGDWRSVAEKIIELFESGNFENKKGEELLGKYSWEKIAEIELSSLKYS